MSWSNIRGRAGQRGGRGNRGRWVARPKIAYDAGPAASLGNVVKRLLLKDLNEELSESKLRACGEDCVASFNLMEGQNVAITVPGMPPKWTPETEPRRLDEDGGSYYRDVNAAHNPQGPWQATAEVIMRQAPVQQCDILACGSTLGNLIRLASRKPQDCRILVNSIGGAVHLTRRESSPKATIPDVRGYGHTFPEANTTWDSSVKGSMSHQRVVSFDFAGLSLLVRSEADGHMPLKDERLDYVQTTEASMNGSFKMDEAFTDNMDDLEAEFAAFASATQHKSGGGDLDIKESGASVPQKAIFELKTRTIKSLGQEMDIIAEQVPRLWVRRVPTLILAYHDCGVFADINPVDVRPLMTKWEEDNQKVLSKLAALLREIIAAVNAQPSKKLEITMEAYKSELCFREQLEDAPALFPTSTAQKWEEWLAQDRDADNSDILSSSDEDDEENVEDKLKRGENPVQDLTICDEECGYCGHCR